MQIPGMPQHLPRARVLYVDDEAPMVSVVSRILGNQVQLETTTSSSEALGLVAQGRYDIVMTDLRMPEHDGVEVLRAARAARPDVLGIVVTGAAELDTALTAINELSVFRFLLKPWATEELLAAVGAAVEIANVKKENERVRSMLERRNRELLDINFRLDHLVAERTSASLGALVSALDLRDTETGSHSHRVALFARRLAEELELPSDECVDIERGALLHDIGKIGVSDTILRKPAGLTEAEWIEMRKHALFGARILDGIDFLRRARMVVEHHHERWDGKGYPHGLQGESIYLGARIFAVIDTYDAITSDRPYRKARGHDVALAEIKRCTGTQFDPRVVAAFERIDAECLERIRQSCPDQALEHTAVA